MSLEKEQYVIVTRDWVLLCPESVDSRLEAELHLANVVGYHEDCLFCPVKTFYEIRDDLISFRKCTQSFDQTDVWFGVAGMQNWVELAGMSNKLIGNAYEWAKQELESRGLEPHWVVNLQEALEIFSRAPLPVIKGGGDSALTMQTPPIGSFVQGGYYAGLVNVKGVDKAIIVAPKAQGEYEGKWSKSHEQIPGASCPVDGQQNTRDMIAAGVDLGMWVQALGIGGFTDWHIPSRDQLEIIYRAFKPANYENAPYSGINSNSVPAHSSYTSDDPLQCKVESFKRGGTEAFDHSSYYWTSTQINEMSVCILLFHDGGQTNACKDNDLRARAVRTINVSDLVI